MGIRRLIELGLDALHDPVAQCVRAVDRVLQNMVERAVERSSRANPSPRAADGDRKPVVVFVTASRIHPRVPRQALGQIVDRRDGRVFDRRSRRRPSRRGASTLSAPAAVADAALAALDRHKREAESMVAALVAMEGSYFDADFFRRLGGARTLERIERYSRRRRVRGSRRIFDLLDADAAPQSTFDGADAHLRAVASSVHAYVDAVRARMAKAVPKAVVHCQVLARVEVCSRDFTPRSGYLRRGPSRVDAEDPAATRRREACRARLTLLNRARSEIAATVG